MIDRRHFYPHLISLLLVSVVSIAWRVHAADKLVGLHSAQVMSQSMPWIAQEAGLFKKYDLDFQLIFISSSGVATAATLGGDAEIALTGGIGNVRAYVQGATDIAFIGGVKNIGSNTHYFVVQALRRFGMDANKDIQPIQTGGGPETLAALVSGGLDAAAMTAPADVRAVAQGYRFVINGPELRIPYAATSFVTLRSLLNKRGPVFGRFMRVMAEASRILHTDKPFVYKVLGKYLRVGDTKILAASYQSEVPALEQRLEIRESALQATLDEIAQSDPRAKSVKPQELIDRRYLIDLEKSGVFGK
jgi:ABC-type nitrate/sulfonate/bicarbonate transport system substrate-binding protein